MQLSECLTSYFPFNHRRQQAQSLGRFINQLSSHSDCLLNQCGRVTLSVLVVVNGSILAKYDITLRNYFLNYLVL